MPEPLRKRNEVGGIVVAGIIGRQIFDLAIHYNLLGRRSGCGDGRRTRSAQHRYGRWLVRCARQGGLGGGNAEGEQEEAWQSHGAPRERERATVWQGPR